MAMFNSYVSLPEGNAYIHGVMFSHVQPQAVHDQFFRLQVRQSTQQVYKSGPDSNI